MFKWIVTDLDGTLLDFNEKTGVSFDTNTGKILNKVIATKKYEFTIATGRHYKNVLDILTKYDIRVSNKAYILGMNGAQIYSCAKKQLIQNIVMDNKALLKLPTLIQYLEKNFKDKYLLFGYQDTKSSIFFHRNDSSFFRSEIERMNKYENDGKSLDDVIIDDFSQVSNVSKIIITFKEDFDYKQVCLDFGKIFPDMNFAKSAKSFVEIFPNTVNKQIALQHLNDNYLHFKKEEILGFGDSYNDSEFLSWVGTSVTRETAEPFIKNLCDYVIDAPASTFVGDGLTLLLGGSNED